MSPMVRHPADVQVSSTGKVVPRKAMNRRRFRAQHREYLRVISAIPRASTPAMLCTTWLDTGRRSGGEHHGGQVANLLLGTADQIGRLLADQHTGRVGVARDD